METTDLPLVVASGADASSGASWVLKAEKTMGSGVLRVAMGSEGTFHYQASIEIAGWSLNSSLSQAYIKSCTNVAEYMDL